MKMILIDLCFSVFIFSFLKLLKHISFPTAFTLLRTTIHLLYTFRQTPPLNHHIHTYIDSNGEIYEFLLDLTYNLVQIGEEGGFPPEPQSLRHLHNLNQGTRENHTG